MGASNSTGQLGAALFGKSKRALLALFFIHPERSFYLRQVTRMLGIGQGAVQRELARLVEAGLLVRTRVGSQVHYQANAASPIFGELKAVMVKTAGVADVLREALAGLAEEIALAFVYGSLARGEGKANSDVDVMIIGAVSFGEVVSVLQSAQKTIGREVNPSVYSEREFREKLRARHQFVASVASAPKVFLVGGEHELNRLA
ncbi:MAG: nucleotidyltransferase domain-containing protein [Verrucomicrobia bacterium]|nr:nucleotidyltransferase domain-containing protein [Verrucomicrobiota bacterium]